jgi:hypothetical protein
MRSGGGSSGGSSGGGATDSGFQITERRSVLDIVAAGGQEVAGNYCPANATSPLEPCM